MLHYVLHYENSQLYLGLGLKLTAMQCILESNQSQWFKTYSEFTHTQKERKQKKNGDKEEKAMLKLINNAIYRKTMRTSLRTLECVFWN